MAKVKSNNFEKYREYAQYFTMAMSLLYALYWAVLSITNTAQTVGIQTLGNIILVLLVAGGMIMGFLYALRGSEAAKK